MNKLKKLADKLSKTEEIFCQEYLKHGNKLKAYQSAFPDCKELGNNPYDFGRRVGVRNYLQEVKNMATEKTVLDKAWVLNRLKENSDLGTNGWEVGDVIKKDLSASNRASELIGKDLGMFTNEVNINGLDELVKGLVDKADLLASDMDTDEPE